MKLTPYQLQIQESMLCKIHNCGIEEARIKEEDMRGCLYNYNDGNSIVIGLPPTLSRVLYCLGDDWSYGLGHIKSYCELKVIRKLLKENGKEATLWDQTEETQKTIGYILLGNK